MKANHLIDIINYMIDCNYLFVNGFVHMTPENAKVA